MPHKENPPFCAHFGSFEAERFHACFLHVSKRPQRLDLSNRIPLTTRTVIFKTLANPCPIV